MDFLTANYGSDLNIPDKDTQLVPGTFHHQNYKIHISSDIWCLCRDNIA